MASLATEVFIFVATASLFLLHKKVSASSTCDAPGALKNSAFVFVKPHANTVAAQELVKQQLVKAGIEILSERDIDGKTIDENKLIDQHYYAIGRSTLS